MKILGIDPGTATTGYGVVKFSTQKKVLKDSALKINIKKTNLKLVEYGCVKTTPEFSDAERLRMINSDLRKLIKKHRPKILAIENVFFFRNMKTALPVSQAKGVIMLAAARKKIPVYEFTPLEVKMIIGGHGWTKKRQIQEIIKDLFNLEEIPKPNDASDAIGIAICGALKKCYYKNPPKKINPKKA
jgi:crossover junction endodeoxyribonuclease RuvC